MSKSTKSQKFEGTVSVCAHSVTFCYSDIEFELTPELEQLLEKEAEDRARHCINEGYISGELNCTYILGDSEEEGIYGWWEID